MKTIKNPQKFFLLNLIWLLFSLPVVTIGISTCAAYYVALKIFNDDTEEGLFKLFVKSFKQNVLQGFLMTVVTAITFGAAGGLWYWIIKTERMNFIWGLVALVVSLLILTFNIFAYPMIARYSNTFKNILKNNVAVTVTYGVKTFKTAIIVAIELGIFALLAKLSLIAGLVALLFWPVIIFYTVTNCVDNIYYQLEHPQTYDDEETDSADEEESEENPEENTEEDSE